MIKDQARRMRTVYQSSGMDRKQKQKFRQKQEIQAIVQETVMNVLEQREGKQAAAEPIDFPTCPPCPDSLIREMEKSSISGSGSGSTGSSSGADSSESEESAHTRKK